MRRLRNVIALIVLAGLAVFAARTIFRPRPIEVESQPIGRGPVEDVVANSEGGTVRSRAQSRLGVETAGTIDAIPRREGDAVRRGEIVVSLETSTAARRLEGARRELEALDASHEAAHAADRLAQRALARIEPLREQGLAAAEQLDEARARADAAQAELKAAEARLAGARAAIRLVENEVAHHIVRAPFDGVVTRRFVEVGESVVPGQAVIEVVSVNRLYVSAPIDERDAGRLVHGLPARVTLDSYPGVEWSASVSRIAPYVETVKDQNRTIEIELELRPDPRLPAPRPGMTADVEVILDRRDGVLRVPSLAVGEGGRVFVVERGRAASRTVEAGLRNWQWTEVRSGLAAGDRVITTLDRPGLKSGVAIRGPASAPAGGAAPDSGVTASVP